VWRAPRQGVRAAQRLAALLGVDVRDADRVEPTAGLPAGRDDRDRARRAVHQPVRGRARKDAPERALPRRAHHEQAGVIGLGRLVERPRGARAGQPATLDRDPLRLERSLRLRQRVRGIHDEVLVLLPGARPVTFRADRGDDERRSGEACRGDAEVDWGAVGGRRVVPNNDRLAHPRLLSCG
jgi:hypothetical protein